MKTVFADFDQIVFEDREHHYGAYEMRRNYNRRLTRALLIAMLVFLSVTALPQIISWMTPAEEAIGMVETEILDEFPPILPPPPSIEDNPPPPQPPKVKVVPPAVKTIEYKVADPKPKDEIDDKATISEIEDINAGTPDLETKDGEDALGYNWDDIGDEGTFTGVIDEPVVPQKEIGPKDFVLLEKEPAPVNMDAIKKLIGYPELAKEAELEGDVVVRVQVNAMGDYVKHIVLKNPHQILTNEVAKQLHHLKFTPGIQAGKPIKVWVTIPFSFKLLK